MEFNEVLSLSSASSESIIKIHHELSLNHCTLLCSLSCMKMGGGLIESGGLFQIFCLKRGLIRKGGLIERGA